LSISSLEERSDNLAGFDSLVTWTTRE
jgi:hypothetical protein